MEADETYVLESRKGARKLGRKARRRGGKTKKRGLSREQVPVLMAADRGGTIFSVVLPTVDATALTAALEPVVAKDALLVSDGGTTYPPCAVALGVSHETLNRSMGERVRGDLHIQTVNSRHSRLKDFPRPRRGIATRYLDNYLSWFHLVDLAPAPMIGPASPPPSPHDAYDSLFEPRLFGDGGQHDRTRSYRRVDRAGSQAAQPARGERADQGGGNTRRLSAGQTVAKGHGRAPDQEAR